VFYGSLIVGGLTSALMVGAWFLEPGKEATPPVAQQPSTTMAAGPTDGRSAPAAAAAIAPGPAPARRGPLGVLVGELRGLPPEEYDLMFTAGDERARGLSLELGQALDAAGWTSVSHGPLPATSPGLGVLAPRPSRGGDALVNWARRTGFTAEFGIAPRMPRLRVVVGSAN
jgi:hypothetical protein